MVDKDELREHSFDGIQEYDNDLPRWWVWLFVITVVISLAYPFIYDFGPGQFASESIDAEMALAKSEQPSHVALVHTDDSLQGLVNNTAILAEGQRLYTAKCAVCHGDKGQGIVGPNLTDEYWIHGGEIGDVHRVVVEGVLDKGMLSWKTQLTPEQIHAVVAFVWSIYGTNPSNPKAPQGERVERKAS